MLRSDDVPQELVIESEQIVTYLVFLAGTTVFLEIRSPAQSAIVIRQVKETIGMLKLCFATSGADDVNG
jgi:hypothetical protein